MKQLTIYMAAIAMILSACNSGGYKKNNASATNEAAANSDKPEGQNPSPSRNKQKIILEQIPVNKTPAYENWDKKIIKNAFIRIELKNYAVFNQSIHTSLKDFGAYISEEEQNQAHDQKTNKVTIKVPVEQFENLINSLENDSTTVIEKKISSEEVGGDLVDTQSRIETKKQLREKYLGLLKDAKNMKEILGVQQEINGVQESIESASGRVKYLTHQSAYSTVHLQYFQNMQTGVPAESQSGYLVRLGNSFYASISVIGDLFVLIVILWPVILGVLIALIIWKKRKINLAKSQ